LLSWGVHFCHIHIITSGIPDMTTVMHTNIITMATDIITIMKGFFILTHRQEK